MELKELISKNSDSKVKILFIWQVKDRLREFLEKNLNSVNNLDLIFLENANEEEYLKNASEVKVIVGWRPTKKLLLNSHKLELFINPGVGVQHLIELFREINEIREKPITLVNGHGNTYFTAQHAVALLLSLMNKIIPHHNWMKDGEWRKGDNDARSSPLRSRNVGLLGYGEVNKKVHIFLQGFDVEFSILRKDWSKQNENLPTKVNKYRMDEISDFLKAVDILIIAVPQTSLTINLIGKKELELLGKEGLVINVGRGLVINEDALFESLNEKIISGAAIDVWYNYQPETDNNGKKFPFRNPFNELDNIIFSPHRGASPMNDLLRWNEVIENLTRFSNDNKKFLNIVNLEDEY